MEMKKYYIVLLLTLFSSVSKSQDLVKIKHTNYTSVFSKSKRYPVSVDWWLTKKMVGCKNPLIRKDNFKPDPNLPKETNLSNDYKNSGYDKGHMMPASDNLCQTQLIQDECFYFSNIVPQLHNLNNGSWKSLEIESRSLAMELDSIHIWSGAVGSVKKIGSNKISVPSKCWKVIFIKKTKEYRAYIFPNTSKKLDLEKMKVKKEDVEKLTNIKFD